MQKSASDSKLPTWPKHFYFSDNSMCNRSRHQYEDQPRSRKKKGGADDALAQLDVPEENVRATSGWDKYFFFSVTGDKEIVSKAARMGRSRPAKTGPQTFLMQDFSPEEFQKAKNARGAAQFSMYTQSFSQLPRSSTILKGSGASSLKESGGSSPSQQEAGKKKLVADYPTTMTPHIFPNGHKTFVELFATDRPAPAAMCYTVFNGT